MNIWILNHYATPPIYGGANRHFYLSKYVIQNGHDLKIFTASKIHNTSINLIQNNELFKKETVMGIDYIFVKSSDYKANGFDRMWTLLEVPWYMWKTCLTFEKPDIIYASSPSITVTFMAHLLAKKLQVPFVMEVRDLWPESIVEFKKLSVNNPVILFLRKMEKYLYTKAVRLIFTMEGGLAYIKERGWENQVNPSKIRYINNFISIEDYDHDAIAYKLDDEDLLEDNTFKIVYAGSIRPANNIDFLVDIAKIMQKKQPRVVFLVYGEGNHKLKLEERAKREYIRNIKFKGFVNKQYIPFVLSKANINILNYEPAKIWRYGGSQNKLFSYFASGKPILANIKMGYDLIAKYNAGISVDGNDVNAVVAAIEKFIQMPDDEYNAYCKNARRAAEDYDYKKMGEKLLQTLLEVV